MVDRLVDGPDVWLSGLAHLFRASFAENEGDLDQVRHTAAPGRQRAIGWAGPAIGRHRSRLSV